MKTAYIITKPENEGSCPSCVKAKALLQSKGFEIVESPLPIEARLDYYKGAGVNSIPQIYFEDGRRFKSLEALQEALGA